MSTLVRRVRIPIRSPHLLRTRLARRARRAHPAVCRAVAERRRTGRAAGTGSGRAGLPRFFEIVGTGLSTLDEQIARRHEASGFVVRESLVRR